MKQVRGTLRVKLAGSWLDLQQVALPAACMPFRGYKVKARLTNVANLMLHL